MKTHKIIAISIASFAICATSAVSLTGCRTGATAGGTTYSYEFATLRANLPHSLDAVYAAAEDTVEEYGLQVEERSKDAFEARIIARGARDQRHSINISREGDSVTSVSISVGALGDEVRSRELMSSIERSLQGSESRREGNR